MGYAAVIGQHATLQYFHKNTCNKPQRFMEVISFSEAGRFWFIPLHVPNEDRKRDSCWLLQVPNLCTLRASATVFVGQCEMVCMSPSVHDISVPSARISHSHMAHCLLVWSQQRRHTLIRTCTHTEALSVTASLFTHWDTLSTFIALSQWDTLSEKSPVPSTPRPPLRQPQAWTAPCTRVTACLFYSASQQTLQTRQRSSTHSTRKTHQTNKYCRNNRTNVTIGPC